MQHFQDTFGERGAAVIRFEWRCWKRLLQTDGVRPWRPVNLDRDVVAQRLCRQDAMAQDDWSLVCRRHTPARPVVVDDEDGEEALRNEYLVSAMPEGGYYTMDTPARQEQPDGTFQQTAKRTHFWLLDNAHGNHRPHVMPTAHRADEVLMRSPLALLVVRTRIRPLDDDPQGGAKDTFHLDVTGDPEWVSPKDLSAAHDPWHNALVNWSPGASDHPGCVALTEPRPVKIWRRCWPRSVPRCP